jgi:hypothetical protein
MAAAANSIPARLQRLEQSPTVESQSRLERLMAEQMREIERAMMRALGDDLDEAATPNPVYADQSVPLEVRVAALLAD